MRNKSLVCTAIFYASLQKFCIMLRITEDVCSEVYYRIPMEGVIGTPVKPITSSM